MGTLLGQASVCSHMHELCSLDWPSHDRLHIYAIKMSVPRLSSLWSPGLLSPQNSYTVQQDPLYRSKPYPHLPATCGPLPARPGPLLRERQEGAASW